jgi:hypothetical protein
MNPKYQSAVRALSNGYEGHVPENYEGKIPNRYSGGFNYDGETDPSWADEAQLSQKLIFSFQISNNQPEAVNRVIALNPGYFRPDQIGIMRGNNGEIVDAIIREGIVIGAAGVDALVVKSQNKPIDELLDFVLYNPMRFVGMKMQCSNPDQFSQSLLVKQLSPFRNLSDYTLTPDDYKDSRQMDATRAEIPLENFQFDNNTQVVWTILAGSTLNLSLFGGAVLNMAKELDNVARMARRGLDRSYGPDYMKTR